MSSKRTRVLPSPSITACPGITPDERAREAIHQVVGGARNLGEALIRQDPQWLEEGPVFLAKSGSWGTELDTTHEPSKEET
jgi:hypothetical protein